MAYLKNTKLFCINKNSFYKKFSKPFYENEILLNLSKLVGKYIIDNELLTKYDLTT